MPRACGFESHYPHFCGGSAPEWHACACRKLLNPSQLALTAPFRGIRPSRCCGRWLRCFGFLQNLADAPPRPLTRSHRTSVRRRRPGCSEEESVGREPQRMVRRRSLCQKCRGWHRFSKGTCQTAKYHFTRFRRGLVPNRFGIHPSQNALYGL